MLLYMDTCMVIYLVEEHPVYCPRVEAALARTQANLCFSPLVELESLVLPVKQNNSLLLDKYHRFFALNNRLEMPREIFLKAAQLRAEYALKTPDALHLATALHHGCNLFWTNDDRLSKVNANFVLNVLNHH